MSEATDTAAFLQQSIQTALTSLGIPEPVATEGSEGYSSARLVSMRLMAQTGRGGDFDQHRPVKYTGSRPKADPTPEEIAAECAAIRADGRPVDGSSTSESSRRRSRRLSSTSGEMGS